MILILGTWQITVMGILFGLVCLFMMLVILIQKPKGGGLSGAFGGAGGGSAQAAFGAKTGDVLTGFTVFLFVLFLALSVGLTWMIRPTQHTAPAADSSSQSTAEQALHHAASGGLPAAAPEDQKPQSAAGDTQGMTQPAGAPTQGSTTTP